MDFGIAMQLTNILRDLREDAERGRLYLPLDEMARHGYSEDDLRRGTVNEEFRALMAAQAARARRYFASGARLLPLVEAESRGCAEGLLRLYSRLLDRMESRGWDVFSRRASLSTAEKLALTCKLWTNAKLRRALGAVTSAVVVGGGIAGMAAALRLARAGASVTLVERRPLPGRAGVFVHRPGDGAGGGQRTARLPGLLRGVPRLPRGDRLAGSDEPAEAAARRGALAGRQAGNARRAALARAAASAAVAAALSPRRPAREGAGGARAAGDAAGARPRPPRAAAAIAARLASGARAIGAGYRRVLGSDRHSRAQRFIGGRVGERGVYAVSRGVAAEPRRSEHRLRENGALRPGWATLRGGASRRRGRPR